MEYEAAYGEGPGVEMTRWSEVALQRGAGMMKAAADPERLRVLALLFVEGEMTVTDIVQGTGALQSTVSNRLRILLEENLVKRRIDGRQRLYALADDHVRALVENVLDHADPSVRLTK